MFYCLWNVSLYGADHTQATIRLLALRLQERLPDFFNNPKRFESYMLKEEDKKYKDQIVIELLKPYELAIAAQNYHLMKGHTDSIHTIDWHPYEATKLASGSADKTVCVWSAMQGLLKKLQGHTDWVQSVAWHPNGKLLASGSADRTVRIWDIQASKTIQVFSGHENVVNAVSWNKDGTRLASGSTDTTIAIWDHIHGRRFNNKWCGCAGVVSALDWHPANGDILVSGDFNSHVNKWINGWLITPLCNHAMNPKCSLPKKIEKIEPYISDEHITSVHWHPDGQRLAASSCQGISIWNMQENKLIKGIRSKCCWIKDICWHPDGKTLASAGGDGSIIVWDANSWNVLRELKHPKAVKTIDWNCDGSMIASGTLDKDLYIWHKNYVKAAQKLSLQQALYIIGVLKEIDVQGANHYFEPIKNRLPMVFKRLLHYHAKQVASFKAALVLCQQETNIHC